MEISRHWRLKAQRYRLEGSRCKTCGEFTFPPRRVCSHCMGQPLHTVGDALPIVLTSTTLAGTELLICYPTTERLTE